MAHRVHSCASYGDEQEQPLLETSDPGQPLRSFTLLKLTLHLAGPELGFDEPAQREQLERQLLRKVDKRMSILILIYILNCASLSPAHARPINATNSTHV